MGIAFEGFEQKTNEVSFAFEKGHSVFMVEWLEERPTGGCKPVRR